LPGNHALELLPRLHLVDQPGAVGGEVCPQKDSSRPEPVPDTQPRCISAGGSGVGARGVGKQDVGKQGFGKHGSVQDVAMRRRAFQH
jgi:hypothetical protein